MMHTTVKVYQNMSCCSIFAIIFFVSLALSGIGTFISGIADRDAAATGSGLGMFFFGIFVLWLIWRREKKVTIIPNPSNGNANNAPPVYGHPGNHQHNYSPLPMNGHGQHVPNVPAWYHYNYNNNGQNGPAVYHPPYNQQLPAGIAHGGQHGLPNRPPASNPDAHPSAPPMPEEYPACSMKNFDVRIV